MADEVDPAIVAVLGNEGVGKTWLVAQWWSALSAPPILILVAGRRAANLRPGEPIESLARLLAQQAGNLDDRAIRGWKRRLQRWKAQGHSNTLRFIVVFDGINEQPTLPWADLIKEMSSVVSALGGSVIVTSRPAFWNRDVFPRLRATLTVKTLEVDGYSDQELTDVLLRAGFAITDLSAKVLDFIRNPRVCAIALNLLDRLKLLPNELTVDRLLLEYWRSRLQECGNLLAHNIRDFDKLLQSHARSWLTEPTRSFDRDEWSQHSGAAKRHGQQHVQNDLTEIEEGRFLQIASGDTDSYEFRSEVLPYALGLLINSELKDELKKGEIDAAETLDRILELVRGLDRVADIIAAATGIACLDSNFPCGARRILIGAWLGLQNIDEDAFNTMAAYVSACPDSFLDVIEWPATQTDSLTHHPKLLAMIIAMRGRPTVQIAIANRLRRWLGSWSRQAPVFSTDGAQIKRQTDWEVRIAERLRSLSATEMERLRALTSEEPEIFGMPLDHLAALVMIGHPIKSYASALFGWALAQSTSRNIRSDDEGLAWVIRLNTLDWMATASAIRELIVEINELSSDLMKQAAATLLHLLGDKDSSDRADILAPPVKGERWRRIEFFCNTNPHDPDAGEGTNIENSRNAANTIEPLIVWNHMSPTVEDHDLASFTAALARFDRLRIVTLLRAVAATATRRTGLQLRQLAWRLPGISPLLDDETIEVLRQAYDALCADPSHLKVPDSNWAASCLFRVLAQHCSAETQLDLLLRLPSDCPFYLALQNNLDPLPARVLDDRLRTALVSANVQDFKRILFFASSSKAELTPGSRAIVADALKNNDTTIAMSAADVTYMAEDSVLNSLILQPGATGSCARHPNEDWRKKRAIATAVVSNQREDMIPLVPTQFLDFVASKMGGSALDLLVSDIQRVLDRLLKSVITPPPEDISVYLGTSVDGSDIRKWVEENNPDRRPRDLRDGFADIGNPAASVLRQKELQKVMVDEMLIYERALTDEGAAALTEVPPVMSLHMIALKNPHHFDGWIQRILETDDVHALARVRNLGLRLAGSYATRDPAIAAKVFRHLKDRGWAVNVVIGNERIPIYEHALFSAPDSVELELLRRELFATALDDATLEMETVAAEVCGAASWLTKYVDELVASDQPAFQARGLTIAGLRQANLDSDRTLALDVGGGFLGQASAFARKSYRRAEWARYWLDSAAKSIDPIEFWRFSTLAEGVCDIRAISIYRDISSNTFFERYGADLIERLKSSAEERSKKRAKTLFGLKKPEDDIAPILRDALAGKSAN